MVETARQTGERARQALRRANVRQVDAAAALRISQSQLSRRLAGHIALRVDELETLAELAGVTSASLVSDAAELAA